MKICLPLSTSKTQHFVNQAYVDFVTNADFHAVLVAPGGHAIDDLLESDGLLLPGGIDVDPIYYGVDNYSCTNTDTEKDAFERALLRTALERGIPVFGICRGLQLIAREYMLDSKKARELLYFEQHVPSHSQVDSLQVPREKPSHFVHCFPDILYNTVVEGKEIKQGKIPVNSMHHQAVTATVKKNQPLTVGKNFHIVAWTERGLKSTTKNLLETEIICEAFRIYGWGAEVLAVQWHPEELMDVRLIKNFFGAKAEEKAV